MLQSYCMLCIHYPDSPAAAIFVESLQLQMEKTSTSTHVRFYCYFWLSCSSWFGDTYNEVHTIKRGNAQLIDWELSLSFYFLNPKVLVFTQMSLFSVKQVIYLQNQQQTVTLLLSASQNQRLVCGSTATDKNTLFCL